VKVSQLFKSLIIISPLGFLLNQPIVANEIEQKANTSQLEISAKPSTRAADLLAQETTSRVIKITRVKLNSTDADLEVILESDLASTAIPVTRTEGNIFIAELKNAILTIPEGNGFQAKNPAAGITRVSVTQVDETTIEVSVIGIEKVPNATVRVRAATTTQQRVPTEPDEGEEEIVATGQQDTGYRVPNATTATKTDTPLRDIPQSIQVIPRQVIEDQGSTRISDITRNVSGVNTTTGPSGVGEFFTIRGFSGNEFGGGNEFRNGFRSLGLGSFNSGNIERVEVLKGPASVLYGQIEPGGIINFVTKQPVDRPYYSGDLEIGSFNFYRPSLDISGPLTNDKRLLYRLNLGYENSGSFVNFVDRQIIQIAPTFSYTIGDNTKLTLSYEYLSEEGTNNPGLPRNPIAFRLPRSLFLGEPEDTVDSEAQALTFGLEHRFSKNWQLRSRFAWQSESFKRNAFRIGRRLAPDGRTLGRQLQVDTEDRTNSYSIQTDLIGKFKTGSIEHQLLFGIEWVNFRDLDATGFAAVDPIDILNPLYGVPRPTLFDEGASRLTTRSNTIGLYLQDQVTLLPNLKILVGGRYEFIDEKSGFQELGEDGVTEIDSISENSFFNQAFSPRVGIVYQPIKPISLYASYSTSFIPNNTLTSTGELIEPTRGTQFEIGVKAEAFDGKLAATLATYQITKTNVLTTDPDDPDFSIPIGKTRSRGIEFDIAGKPLPGWNVIGSFFFNDSVVTVGDENNPVGDTLIDAPKSGASLWTTYEIQSGDLKGLGFGGGLFYVGEVEAELPNSFVLPSYVRTDATIFYRRDNWKIGLNFKNLFNTRYYTNQGAAIYPGEPFTILGSVSVSF
jgi:iron complex outermembrane recepter protein